ncbi:MULTISPECIES: 2-C-methyl-D-erythritol 4-phosphate cytidylyltransferase [Cytobacillus]|jgi:2-C-methyl-D-erythritol 4-phosphate cytidylyltransferase|uniref:2-C-methyl-D-erythritol 4-phosphate cytidylyltransferase n=1 Tax=Cytobacillus TaxID=2675230 RepID=UPI00186476F5|nr:MULTISPECIES: 2-C-methyl-D-erythritol 4-phosphate cytidylyltransferase [Cytobacillus]MBY0155753.1 2-C-methyl-D-erythritol 4-phosphate cytidylyltransferase [Cytobacillus firmus]MCM3395710.1 2-C-methyl-D-erythritol 4-phosphate cytidylyltransferase [Cytobacillus oceanisediminis]MCM3405599.1 2-C-methyl-D-erythritol 4-phosphate cytidylyltransferase [Cytobacillus oceanisediminis]MCM3532297.1 2-C-methyl-D-erythritol 4-phosphate cytidylyltransferase [Cytobacillus oceanisediminis]MDK7669517.1 2-C-me
MNYQVILPAAGQGKRMGAGKNKLLLEIGNVPVFIHTLRVFESDAECTGIYLAINPQDEEEIRILLKEHQITKVAAMAEGGQERQHSVYNAAKAVSGEQVVLVHDAARPFITRDLLQPLVKAAWEKGAAVLAVPLKDTVKKADGNLITETLERSCLWAVQTPQAFRVSSLLEAHRKAEEDGFLGTDDASLVERLGNEVVIVQGSYDNIKLTTPEDIYFAEAIIKKRSHI